MNPANLATSARRVGSRGFTLIEIMIVVAIIGMILGIGVPSMVRAMRKEGMRAAVDSVLEACQQARATAILTQQTVELVYSRESRELRIVPMAAPPQREALADGSLVEIVLPPDDQAKLPTVVDFKTRIADDIVIELFDVNYIEMKDSSEARVKFHPNSTSDEFSIVLRSSANEWRKVSLDVLTAIPDVELIR